MKKQILSTILIMSTLLPSFLAFAAEGTLIGSGTESDPYQIFDSGDLSAFRDKVNSGDGSVCGKLMGNIVLNPGTFDQTGTYIPEADEEAEQWMRIGSNAVPYTGTFDGNGFTISGLYINTESDNQGLFGWIQDGAVIKNLGVTDSFVKGNNFAGGVVGFADECHIINCYHEGVVRGNNEIGGIMGYNFGNVENCYNVGYVYGSSNVGGVSGDNYNTIEGCYNTGAVSGFTITGGAIGYNYLEGVVENTYNTGEVSAESDFIGGVVGVNDEGTVKNTYNTGKVSGGTYVGGAVGFNYGSVINSFYLSGSAEDNGLGTAIDKEQLAVEDTYTDWDFSEIWYMDKDLGRPVLRSIPENNDVIEYGFKSVSYNKTDSGYNVTVDLTKPAENYVLITALYDGNGGLVSFGKTDTNGKDEYVLDIPSEKECKSIKVFLWNGVDEGTPICDMKQIYI